MQHEKIEGRWILCLSTYPPRECGIATFTRDLTHAIDRAGSGFTTRIAALNSGLSYMYDKKVKYQLEAEEAEDYLELSKRINRSGKIRVVNVQHEYGIFGGEYGSHLIPFLKNLQKPVVTTMHTVLPGPNPDLKRVTQEIVEHSDLVVVMAEIARSILKNDYGVDSEKIRLIPHGVPDFRLKPRVIEKNRKLLLTFGLLDSRKGVEYVIDAMPKIVERHPDALYCIIGETHPSVLKREGENYRNMLMAKVKDMGLKKHVKFYNEYLVQKKLIEWLRAADVYIAPSLDPNQVTSGTIAYAVGCGRAIVSTPCLYAKEMLSDDRGLLVGFEDPDSIANAVNRILSDKDLRQRFESNARELGKSMTWPNVAAEYLDLFRSL